LGKAEMGKWKAEVRGATFKTPLPFLRSLSLFAAKPLLIRIRGAIQRVSRRIDSKPPHGLAALLTFRLALIQPASPSTSLLAARLK
jgi:hypothetical protein